MDRQGGGDIADGGGLEAQGAEQPREETSGTGMARSRTTKAARSLIAVPAAVPAATKVARVSKQTAAAISRWAGWVAGHEHHAGHDHYSGGQGYVEGPGHLPGQDR